MIHANTPSPLSPLPSPPPPSSSLLLPSSSPPPPLLTHGATSISGVFDFVTAQSNYAYWCCSICLFLSHLFFCILCFNAGRENGIQYEKSQRVRGGGAPNEEHREEAHSDLSNKRSGSAKSETELSQRADSMEEEGEEHGEEEGS